MQQKLILRHLLSFSGCYLINHYKPDAVRIGIANALELIFVAYIIILELDFNL